MTTIALRLDSCPHCGHELTEIDEGLYECAPCGFVRFVSPSTIVTDLTDAVAAPEPAGDGLEIEAHRELALLSRAAEYLTRKIRSRTIPLDRLVAVARERNSIEWDASHLEIALREYQSDLDDRRGR